MAIDISVVIVSYNTRDYLLRCLSSTIHDLQRTRYEIIVVDNNSEDGSPEVVVQQFPTVTLVRLDRNYGFARANNIGFSMATGRYVCLANSDVCVHAGCFERLRVYMDEHPEVALAGPKVQNGDGTVQTSIGRYPSLRLALAESLFYRARPSALRRNTESIKVDFVTGCFMFMRTSVLRQVGLFDEDFYFYFEDVDLCRRLTQAGYGVRYLPEATATHYGGMSTAREPSRYFVQFTQARIQFWCKHMPRHTFLPYLLILSLHHIMRVLANQIIMLLFKRLAEEGWHKVRRNLAVLKRLIGISFEAGILSPPVSRRAKSEFTVSNANAS